MRTARTSAIYDREHRYTIDHRRDPAYPQTSPEPVRTATVAGARKIPAAYSWVACAQPVHHDLVAELLAGMPGRRLLRVVGYGDQSDAWMACSDGPDGVGWWLIPYDTDAAADDLAAAQAHRRRPRGPARRLALLVAALCLFAVVAWTAAAQLAAHQVPDPTRALLGVCAAVVLVGALIAAAVLTRRRHHHNRNNRNNRSTNYWR